MLAVIVHGSLYPYAFRAPAGPAGPIGTLIQSWTRPPSSFGDFVANVLLYMPLGFFGVLALRPRAKILLVTLFGLLVCTCIEIAQFYDQGRVTNLSDVYLNTFGTWLGAVGGTLVGFRALRLPPVQLRLQPIAILLLVAMAGYRLYPYVPVIDAHKYWSALKPLLLHPRVAPWTVFRYFALWLTANYLIAALSKPRSAMLPALVFIGFIFAAKIAIANLELTASEVLGALLATATWFVIRARTKRSAAAVAAVLCAMIVALRLQPFDFHAPPGSFGWLPFRSFLGGSLDLDIVSFLEKAFLYGSLILISSEAGLRLWVVTLAVAALLLVTSLAETYLPGRSAEITDAAMALLIGAVFSALDAANRNRNRDAGAPAPTPPE